MTQTSQFQRAAPVVTAPYHGGVAVTPNDTTDLSRSPTRGLFIGGAGSGALKVDLADGSTVSFASLLANTLLPIAVTRVYATGTNVTGVVALY